MGKRKWAEPGRAEDKKGFGEYSLSVDIDFYSAKISKSRLCQRGTIHEHI